MNSVKQVPISKTVILIFQPIFLQSNYMSIVIHGFFIQKCLDSINFFGTFLGMLIQLINVRSFFDTETVINIDEWSKKYHVNAFYFSVVFVNLSVQNMPEFSQSHQIVIFFWDNHFSVKNFLDSLIIWLFNCEVLSVYYESESIQVLFECFFT